MVFTNFGNKFFNFIPGGFYGLLSVCIMLLGVFIALLSLPDYSMFYYNVSHLALGPGGIYFNLGLIFSGLLAIPFNVYLGKIISDETVNENIRKKAVMTSMLTCLSISLLGIFPAYPEDLTLLFIHGLFAIIFFLTTAILYVIYGYFFIKNSKFSKIQAYVSFIVAGILCAYMLLRWSILEWIAFFAIMISISYTSLFILYKKY